MVYAGLFFAFIVVSLISPEQLTVLHQRFIYLMIAHLGVMLLLMALFGYYCVLLYRDNTLDIAKKVIWIAVFLVTGPFGMPSAQPHTFGA